MFLYLLALPIAYLLYKNITRIGIQYNETIYTLTNVFMTQSSYYGPVLVDINTSDVIVYRLCNDSEKEKIYNCSPYYTLKYIRNDSNNTVLPVNILTKFKVTDGALILCKRQKTRFGWKEIEVSRGTSWPIAN